MRIFGTTSTRHLPRLCRRSTPPCKPFTGVCPCVYNNRLASIWADHARSVWSVLTSSQALVLCPSVHLRARDRGAILRRQQRLPRLLQGAVTVDVHVERRGGDA